MTKSRTAKPQKKKKKTQQTAKPSPLTEEEQREYVSRNWRLVPWVLRTFFVRRGRRVLANHDDMIQEGQLGLIRAAKSFDPARGVKFNSYAVWWIRSFMEKENQHEWNAQYPFSSDTGTVVVAGQNRFRRSQMIRLDEPISNDSEEDSRTLHDTTLVSRCATADEDVALRQRYESLPKVLADTVRELGDDRILTILHHRYFSQNPLTLSQTGEILGISREYVRILENRAIFMMREKATNKTFKQTVQPGRRARKSLFARLAVQSDKTTSNAHA